MRALALGQGFASDFPPGVAADAEYLEKNGGALVATEAMNPKRRDFRKVATFTIDPYDAKDFDDALSVQKLDGGNIEVGVHIADVSFFVKPGTEHSRYGGGGARDECLSRRPHHPDAPRSPLQQPLLVEAG